MNAVRNWLVGGGVLMMLSMAPMNVKASGLPDQVALDSLTQLYEKVTFDHASHISLAKDCAVCHHHTTGTMVDDPNCIRCHRNSNETKVVACRGCHLKDPYAAEALKEKTANLKLYHLDKPGLKRAYHQSCMGCHSSMGGPTECTSCHERTKAGEAFYRTGEYAPKKKAAKNHH